MICKKTEERKKKSVLFLSQKYYLHYTNNNAYKYVYTAR